MTIAELDKELKATVNKIADDWASCGEVDELPVIMQTALNEFRESIIKYLENEK